LTIFQENFKVFQENSSAKMKKIQVDARQVAKHEKAEFQPATQTVLD
jgi:hypothetical protein